MSAQILPLQAALDARRAKAQRQHEEYLEELRYIISQLTPVQQRYMLRVGRAMVARSRKRRGRKAGNVIQGHFRA